MIIQMFSLLYILRFMACEVVHRLIHLNLPAMLLISLLQIPLLPVSLTFSQPVKVQNEPTVIQTKDGMILAGIIEFPTPGLILLNTDFGELEIPHKKISRWNGNLYHPDRGIIRSHSLKIDKSGNIITRYMVPISTNPDKDKVQILVPGHVLDIRDVYGQSLNFFARPFNGFSRCRIEIPEYKIPAVYVEVMEKNAVEKDDQTVSYTYNYIPHNNQIFQLKLTLPDEATNIQIAPESITQTTNTIHWEKALKRQEDVEFEISFQLPESKE